jgi:hypothetical protein
MVDQEQVWLELPDHGPPQMLISLAIRLTSGEVETRKLGIELSILSSVANCSRKETGINPADADTHWYTVDKLTPMLPQNFRVKVCLALFAGG